uniref:Sensitive to high expression protein 9, mitochondrial n=1 Tax=Blastobotrys adeninivorans TaxID=409370 RepID=A0A060SWM3_BLAAD
MLSQCGLWSLRYGRRKIYVCALRQLSSIGPSGNERRPQESPSHQGPQHQSSRTLFSDPRELPSSKDAKRMDITKWFSAKMDQVQAALVDAAQTFNDVTGYSSIEQIKAAILEKETQLKKSREEVQAAKKRYTDAIARRSASQKEVNELLQRKHAWSPQDLERFTDLYRSDHANELEETDAETQLANHENRVEEIRQDIAKLIGSRYHEEQIWSDKIRRASTWGTWMLMGFNIFLFVVVQLGLEPWKRRRLVGSFEDKVKVALESSSPLVQVDELEKRLDKLEQQSTPLPGAVSEPQEQTSEWNTLASRIAHGFEQSASISTSPKEFIVLSATLAVVGGFLGGLLVAAFN